VQGDEFTESDTIPTTLLGTKEPTLNEQRYLLNFGESIKSLRQLFRRSCLVSTSVWASDTTAQWVLANKYFGKIPGMYGYDPNGINSMKGLVVTGSNFPANLSGALPLHTILPAFVAYRGSTMWHFNMTGVEPCSNVRVIRYNTSTTAVATENTVSSATTKGTTSANAFFFTTNAYTGQPGQAVTNQRTNAGISVLCPNYSAYRFQSTAPGNYTAGSSVDGSVLDWHKFEALLGGTTTPNTVVSTLWAYHSIGTDFNMHFFLNCPVIWLYNMAVPN
jgi:hypothetical protein